MLIVAFVLLLIFAYLMPKSKAVFFVEIVLMLFMFSFIDYGGDWDTYRDLYAGYASGEYTWHFEPAFSILTMICARIGLPYVWFRFVVCLMYSLFMAIFIRSETEYIAASTAIMLIFPFFAFVVVIRSGIACPLILCAFALLTSGKYNSKFKFVCLVLLATLFHYSCLVFLPFVITKKRISDTKRILLFISAVVVVILLNYTTVIPELLSSVMSREKTLTWFSKNEGTANITGAICETAILAINLMISKKACEISLRNAHMLKENQIMFSKTTEEVSTLMLYLLPLMWLSSPFMRLSYMTFPMIIVSTINAISTLEKYKAERYLCLGLALFSVALRAYDDLPYLRDGMMFFGEFFNDNYVFI